MKWVIAFTQLLRGEIKGSFNWFINVSLLITPFYLAAEQYITVEKVNEINDQIAKATSDCDFIKATKYYFKDTKFFNYVLNGSDQVITEQQYSEALTAIREAMIACPFSLEKENVISENVMIENQGKRATFHFVSEHYLRSSDGSLYMSRSSGKTIFGVVESDIKILETHYKGISFEQIE